MTKQEAIETIKLALSQVEWDYPLNYAAAFDMAISALQAQDATDTNVDTISRQAAIDALRDEFKRIPTIAIKAMEVIKALPPAQPEIVRCKDCKYWRRQTNYAGSILSFGFCESEDMWASLYGETCEVAHIDTNDNHYCGYAERREDDKQRSNRNY